MRTLLFDSETNGLLPDLTKIHCLAYEVDETGEKGDFADQPGYRPIEEGLSILEDADVLVAHNLLPFDVPAIQKVYPGWKPKGKVIDTLILCRLIWSDIRDRDFRNIAKQKQENLRREAYGKPPIPLFPGKLIGSHSLKAWGWRITVHKDDYDGGWEEWSEDMHVYMLQDVEVLKCLWQKIKAKGYSERAIDIEHRFQELMLLQEAHGFPFDVEKARALETKLRTRYLEIEAELQAVFPPKVLKMKSQYWKTPDGKEWETKKEAVAAGYKASMVEKGRHKTKDIPFNPGSRDHIALRLTEKYQWEPREFTNDGKPKVDESVLEGLKYPETVLLTEYLMIQKRLGALADGSNAWLKLERNGRIHGRVNTLGAVTRRCTHNTPNVTQVPSIKAPYGKECRELFYAPAPMVQVGCDADGIELRMLGHYLAPFDGGAFARAVVEGKKEDESDAHSLNAKALGFKPFKKYVVNGKHTTGRDIAKTFIYAYLYGAGVAKIASILGVPIGKAKIIMDQYLKKMPALKRLKDAISRKVKATNTLKAIDGGVLQVRHEHAALNTLLQSAGGIVMKLAAVLLYEDLSTRGYIWGQDWAQVAHVHDEVQVLARKEIADAVGTAAVNAIREAGRQLGFKCELDGSFDVGGSWAETH